MAVVSKLPDGRIIAIRSVSGPTSYAAGGFTVSFPELKRVELAIPLNAAGYNVEIAGISGNSVTLLVRHFNYPSTVAGAAVEVPAGTDLSGVTFTVIAIGF